MRITPRDIWNIGETTLYDFLGISDRKEFTNFLDKDILIDPRDIQGFADYMSEDYTVCKQCNNNYCDIAEGICSTCLSNLKAKWD